MMNKALVLSRQHHLLPVAHRLRLEGVDVEVASWKGIVPANAKSRKENRFDRAWTGLTERVMRSSGITQDFVDGARDLAVDGKVAVLTDHLQASAEFRGAKCLFPRIEPEQPPRSPLRLGAWWDSERFEAPHVLYADPTCWPMGMGPGPEGAMALIRLDDPDLVTLFHQLTEPIAETLGGEPGGFRGLVQFGLKLDAANGLPQLDGGELGWPWLHTHAFLAELENLSCVVLEDAAPVLEKKYVVVVPVTMPPWPAAMGSAAEVPIEGLTPQRQGQVFWHDVTMKDGQLWTAGLDGLVGVCRGAAGTAELARSKALDLAAAIQIPNKQYRPDAVQSLSMALAGLEGAFNIVV